MLSQVSKSVENNTGCKQEENNGDPRNACFAEVMSNHLKVEFLEGISIR